MAVNEDWKADGATLFSEVIKLDELEEGGTVMRKSTLTAGSPARFLVNEFAKTDNRLLQLPPKLQVLLT